MRTILLTMLTLLSAVIATAQEQTENPYAVFGNDTATLTAEPVDAESHVLAVPVVVADGTPAIAIFDFKHRRAVLLNADGDVLASDTIQDGQRGIWLNVDPKAGDYPHVTPYGYCVGNPIRFVDIFGFAPTEKEAAYIADHVYGDSEELIGGWKEYFKGKGADGLKYGIYERKMKSGQFEYVLAFAGTEKGDTDDILQDISQFLGIGNASQYGQAVNLGRQFAALYNGYEATIVGHSLGGGLATVASMSSGIPAITFNPAALSEFTKYKLSIPNSQPNNIKNYIVAGDPLSMFQHKMHMSLPGKTNVIYSDVPGKSSFNKTKKLHSISVFKEYFLK